ncbi:PE-PPE domain-containing protein [Gordonia soli]|uniref:PE-PPE domain-containing protein n=1 Tax=Gordonia soli NBRC 108243 TaxID=1223545 RepID=M0QKS9_9ACTN|nr:PE-PPE domain-containing protein [Gordonia soli]GAC69054.1 hypothetical protein GS4_20_01190 [Gordonia soli NBRC 108243]
MDDDRTTEDTSSGTDCRQVITVLAVGGTGESWSADRRRHVTGMLSAVTRDLDDRFRSRWVGYPASYGPSPRPGGMSYALSVAEGTRRLRAALAETPGPIALIAYSQGAVVVRTAIHQLVAEGDARVDDILAVGLVADPHQPAGAVDGCSGWGVAGPGLDLPDDLPVHWIGVPGDVICDARPDSFIRDIADLTGSLSFAALGHWLIAMVLTLFRNDFQNAHRTAISPRQWRRDLRRLRSALREVLGYLPPVLAWRTVRWRNRGGGRHISYAVEQYRADSVTDAGTTGCEVLAHWIQVQATFSTSAASFRLAA